MKITKKQLKQIIKEEYKRIVEANPRHDYRSGGVGIAHGDIGSAKSDFRNYGGVANVMLSDGALQKISDKVWNAGNWKFGDCGDGYQFVHTCLYCEDIDTGETVMAVFCRQRNNSHNATNTSYDCYVLSSDLIEDNARTSKPNASWSSWAYKGEYCTSTQQIADTLERALASHRKR